MRALLALCVSNNGAAICNVVLVFRPIKSSTGACDNCSEGQFRHSKSARKGFISASHAFVINLLAVFTAFSTFPLLRGYQEELVWCS